MKRYRAVGHASIPFAVLLVLLAGCGLPGNHARINELQDEFESTQFPYEVALNESASMPGPNWEMTDTNDRNRIVGLAQIDRDMFEVADETLEWLPSAGWQQVVTDCNEDNGEVTAAFIMANKRLGDWEAQIQLSVNPHPKEDVLVFGVLMDAPPAWEEFLPPLDGEVAPCWEN